MYVCIVSKRKDTFCSVYYDPASSTNEIFDYNHNKIDFLHKRSRTMTVGDGWTGTDGRGRTGTDGDGRRAGKAGLTYEPNTQFCA